MKQKSESRKGRIFILLLLIIIAPALWFGAARLEGEAPEVSLDLSMDSFGSGTRLTGSVADGKSGLKEVWIALTRNGVDKVLYAKTFPADGFPGKGDVLSDAIALDADPGKLGLADGKATLRIRVTDHSLRNWLNGNTTYIEKEIDIDTTPPVVDVLSRTHNVAQGGTGLAIYRVSEKAVRSGVRVGENFYEGYSGYYKDHPNVYVAFFALNHLQKPGVKIWVEAEDGAGNVAKAGFYHYIITKKFKGDRINVSDRFLNAKIPPISIDKYGTAVDNNLQKYLVINSKMRADNNRTLLATGNLSEPKMYWKGRFKRLPGSATRAQYADHRSYYYKNELVDQKFHLGLDFASVRQAEIPAANAGKVVFAKAVGIYGKTVVIDHGFGLLSSYSHMSSIRVEEGQMVKYKEVIGRTGVTGLVGGDHLHFGVIVGNTFVNPIEWFDPNWIKNNITSKLKAVEADLKNY